MSGTVPELVPGTTIQLEWQWPCNQGEKLPVLAFKADNYAWQDWVGCRDKDFPSYRGISTFSTSADRRSIDLELMVCYHIIYMFIQGSS